MLEGKNTLHVPFGNGGSPIKMSHFKFRLNEALHNLLWGTIQHWQENEQNDLIL